MAQRGLLGGRDGLWLADGGNELGEVLGLSLLTLAV